MIEEILPILLQKHPKLVKILEALELYYQDLPITTKCSICNQTLQVTQIKAINSLWVTCGKGHIFYHVQGKSKI